MDLLSSVGMSWHPISLYPVVAQEDCSLFAMGPTPKEKETCGNVHQAFTDASFEPPTPFSRC